jgi:hypothetical protein
MTTKLESNGPTPGNGTSGRITALTMSESTATRPPPRAIRGYEDTLGQRQLNNKDNDKNNGYFVDADGNAYEPYAMAWRYLGLFIDCNSGDDERGKQREERRLDDNNDNNNNDNNNNDNDKNNNNNDKNNDGSSSCQRRLLWAAYHDTHYRGGSMGEYSLLNRESDEWEMATCRGQTFWPFTRCKKMDCHARHTSWQLIGVYKESDGLDDWTEQLFKHHGYCHWGQDVLDKNGNGNNNHEGNSRDGNAEEEADVVVASDYEFMQNMRETWSDGSSACRQLKVAGADGNLLYAAVQPLKRGDMTMGLYADSACLEPASTYGRNAVRYGDYLAQTTGAYDDDAEWQNAVDRWNDLLSDYKFCQPCRAFSQTKSSKSDNKNNDNDHDGGNEGEGSVEQWGFNCYDDAGYRNCNQCYKFATKTDMKEASVADLQEASRQGTILAIQYTDGVTYGAGHPVATQHAQHVARSVFVAVASVVVVALAVGVWFRLEALMHRRRQLVKNVALQEEMLTIKKCDREAAAGDGGSSEDDSLSDTYHLRRTRRWKRQFSKEHPRGVDPVKKSDHEAKEHPRGVETVTESYHEAKEHPRGVDDTVQKSDHEAAVAGHVGGGTSEDDSLFDDHHRRRSRRWLRQFSFKKHPRGVAAATSDQHN